MKWIHFYKVDSKLYFSQKVIKLQNKKKRYTRGKNQKRNKQIKKNKRKHYGQKITAIH